MTFVAGRRCRPILLYVAAIIVGLSLLYFSMHRGGGVPQQNPPLHQQ